MSDYMYLLESLVSREQNQLLSAVQSAAAESGVALYLTGGAMRDMLGGFPIRDLDFTFEQLAPMKLARAVAGSLTDVTIEEDAARGSVELKMPSGVTGSLRMAHTAKVSKPGAAPKIAPAHLMEDLSRRDFTVDAIAISLAKASRGLIRDPMNGQSDLHNKEIRGCYSQVFFDDPTRLPRAIRLRHRLGFQIEERTQRYFSTAVAEGWIKTLTPKDWHKELTLIAEENQPSAILGELGASQLLPVDLQLLNLTGLDRFEKLRRMLSGRASHWALFLHVLAEGMKPKERAEFVAAFGLAATDLETGKKMKAKVAKLAATLKSPSLRRPSQVYNALIPAAPAEILFLLYDCEQRVVQDRLKNYLEKFLPEASEITDAQVEATGAKPGTAQFAKAKAALIATRLNTHPAPPEPAVPGAVPGAPATPIPNAPTRAIR
jgi:tRNA nucleotidyltransferase/poly(A) polymerase